VKLLKIKVFPKGEYIVTVDELADEMYFIIKGLVKVTKADGQELAQLKQGDNFGEMALLNTKMPIRKASVVSMTKVSTAVLTLENFNLICQMYPSFQRNIAELV